MVSYNSTSPNEVNINLWLRLKNVPTSIVEPSHIDGVTFKDLSVSQRRDFISQPPTLLQST